MSALYVTWLHSDLQQAQGYTASTASCYWLTWQPTNVHCDNRQPPALLRVSWRPAPGRPRRLHCPGPDRPRLATPRDRRRSIRRPRCRPAARRSARSAGAMHARSARTAVLQYFRLTRFTALASHAGLPHARLGVQYRYSSRNFPTRILYSCTVRILLYYCTSCTDPTVLTPAILGGQTENRLKNS